ncbi:MAG TPA: cellulase [Candidatus Polarisedimenticolia bacterium]|nr:cellulase [Candidatus Polarisedimenticolia bacterium]
MCLLAFAVCDLQNVRAEQYEWRNVVIGGGGFVTGVLFHPAEKNLVYARTDVGGAYRSLDAGKHWTPITDWIQGIDFTGVESFAVDPGDTNRIYLAAGIYSSMRAAILSSDDQGRTWKQMEVPFKMGGNEAGRFNGERLAVDPRDDKILFFGSRRDGLWKSTDFGVTWTQSEHFPKIDTAETLPAMVRTNSRLGRFNFARQEVGIVFVKFDAASGAPGRPTPVLYAGVSTQETNFFRSDDGGDHWSPVANQPLGLRPNHAAFSSDGNIYLSYGKEAGPNTMDGGAVWKFNPHAGAWTDITPLKSPVDDQSFGYGAVAVDAKNPSVLVVTTFGRWQPHDEVFRSTNGGRNWVPLLQNAKWNYSNAPYTEDRVPHWMGSIQIDPFDSNHVLFTTGYGIWGCSNLTDADSGKSTRWNFSDDGLEETVPLALISPPEGAHLLSGLGDIDAFRHDDLDASPAHGNFAGPRFSNTEDLTFAGRKSSLMVRTGTGKGGIHAAISEDGGENWNLLGSEPAGGDGGGTIAVSADGRTIVWTPRRSAPSFSTNNGIHWEKCGGLLPGIRVIADAVNASRFYAFNARTGKLLASTNGAESFSETAATLPAEDGFRFWGVGLSAMPGAEGDLWLALGMSGLFHSTDGGESFTKIETVRGATSIGFGKPAPGKKSPALYLAGSIDGVDGLFRSTDTGHTWMRINDDEHQYGLISHVTGDPRIFGRVYFATSGRGIIYGDEVK